MSTPTTSPKPDTPAGTSNPVPLKAWFAKIGDWISALSPSGATAYDSGEVTLTAAAADWTVNAGSPGAELRARRIGRTVTPSGVAQRATTSLSMTAGTWYTIARVPTGMSPARIAPLAVNVVITSPAVFHGQVLPDGSLQVRTWASGVTLLTGSQIYLASTWNVA